MFKGINGLLASRKATLSLLILACSTTAVLLGKIDGMSYAAIVGTIGSIFMWMHTKTDCAHKGE